LSLVTELRAFLETKLPQYMVPGAFVLRDALPLTPNGKLDRRALLALSTSAPMPHGGFVAPRSPEEELLAALWSEVLHRTPIGVYDNFFQLGGHSLLATRLVARLRARFPLELPASLLFEAPTIAALAARLDELLLAKLASLSEAEVEQWAAGLTVDPSVYRP
jgi:hypothetical protein